LDFDRHKTVDDRPFGGGEGMVLKPEPLFLAVESIWPQRSAGRKCCFPRKAACSTRPWPTAQRLAELLLICGRYEGVDERVAEHLADDELSIGNYVLSGGELAAAVVIDAVARLLPGVLGNEARPCSSRSRNRPCEGHAGLPAMDASRRFSRMESAGSFAERQSRRNPPLYSRPA
jgi:tRNA (guanine-N1)-methyltransferase